MTTLTLQDAKARFSEVVADALRGIRQRVSRRGKDAVVIISASAYDELVRPKDTLIEFFARSPHRDVSLEVDRSREEARAIEL